jgi:hypothetical protein
MDRHISDIECLGGNVYLEQVMVIRVVFVDGKVMCYFALYV